MPLYEYKCDECQATKEIFLPLVDYKKVQHCECGQVLRKVPTLGGIEPDQPTWLNDDCRGALQNLDRVRKRLEKPIETRGEWKRHLKANNIEPL